MGPVRNLGQRIRFGEPAAGLGVALRELGLDIFLLHPWWEQAPPLLASEQGVPRTSRQGVDVQAAAAARRAPHHPAVGRAAALAHMLKQILLEVLGHGVVLQQLPAVAAVPERAVEHVQRRVVPRRAVLQVVQVVLQLQPHRVPVVVAAHLETVLAESLPKLREGPCLRGWPVVREPSDHDGKLRFLESLNELFYRHVIGVDARNIVLETFLR
mmetsp:Transcript_14381/g.27577  ORF Transcript_14381/g.27577 Transcript_14381/m.27577 type:complete len:213 (+) Transcript_14381:1140-1778(+)